MSAIVTLTTDFGTRDSFVAAMKGVLLARCPDLQVVDVCHEVPPQNVSIGALRLASAAPYFPPGTVHVAVVDPGVGSERRAIAITARGQTFVGPDNGVLSLAARPDAPDWRAVEITNPAHRLEPTSTTFHGRDIFAPAAAYLACGGQLDQLGEAIGTIVDLPWPAPSSSAGTIRGAVLDIDRFGNLITNIRAWDYGIAQIVSVHVGGARINGLSTSYDPSRPLVAVASSDGWLEVAAPGADASALLGVGVGALVEVRLGPAGRAAS